MAVQITPLPTPPTRQDPANFSARGDAFLGALPQFQQEANNLAVDVESKAVAAANSATASEASRVASASSATASANSATQAEAEKDLAVIARNEAEGFSVDAENSAVASANSSATSSSFATNSANSATASEASRLASEAARDDAEYWAGQAQEAVTDGIIDDTSLLDTRVRSALDTSRGNFAAVPVTADAAIGVLDFAQITADAESVTVTLPTLPTDGQMVMVGNLTDRRDHRIAVGTVPVKGRDAGGYILIDKPHFTITLKYINATYGWEVY